MVDKQKRVIIVDVRVKGDKDLKKLATQMGSVNRSTKKMASGLSSAALAFKGFIAAIGIRTLVRTADTFQLLQDRISVFAGSGEKAAEIMDDIAVVARHTRSSIDTIAEGFNRVAIATAGTGLSMDQMLGITQTLQQTLRLSGASAQEAASTFLQFTQALSLGRLQGQELRAVMLSNAKVSGLLAESLGVTKGELKLLGEQGKLTNEKVLGALSSNFQQIEKDAGNLGTTFEQSTIILIDTLRIKIHKLNQEFGLSRAFEAFTKGLIDNLETIGIAFIALTTLVVGRAIPSMILAFKAFSFSLAATGIGAALIVVGTLIGALALDWEGSLLKMELAWKKYLVRPVQEFFAWRDSIDTKFINFFKELAGMKIDPVIKPDTIAKIAKTTQEITNLELAIKKLEKKKKTENILDRIEASMKNLSVSTKGGKANPLAALNAQFRSGAIDAEAYSSALERIKINELTVKMNEGKISVFEYNQQLLKIPEAFDKMNLGEQAMAGLESGINSLRSSLGTFAGDIARSIGSAFKGLEDQLVSFVREGKFSFRELTNSILDDLARIAVRQAIVRPLGGALGGLFSSGGGGFTTAVSTTSTGAQFANVSAKGNAFHGGNVIPFASGGVVGGPTLFPMANGAGLMGEAGPEAILPLTRGANGKLGVASSGSSTVVNVINNSSGTTTETQESVGPNGETQIDVLVVDKVKRAIGDGRFDRTFREVYGVTRKGR